MSLKYPTNVLVLDRGNDTRCTVHLFGAQVVSWTINNNEQLFISKCAVFNDKAAVEGGIPIIFPHYGSWDFGPDHGFARIMYWDVLQPPKRLPNGDVEAIFSIKDNDFTRSMWNYPFQMVLVLVLKEKQLHHYFTVINTGEDFCCSFDLALSNNFLVPDVHNCQIKGLKGCTFYDRTEESRKKHKEDRDEIIVDEFTNLFYVDTPQEHVITNVSEGRKMRILKCNFPDTMVFHPCQEKVKEIDDFDDYECQYILCVEVGRVFNKIVLPPGKVFKAGQALRSMKAEGVEYFVQR